ncbi:alanine/glycine:cation symporter family protein [candidate division KSB1 bacterium]
MEDSLTNILQQVRDFVWGPPLIILLVGTGIYLTIILKGLQIRSLWHSLYLALVKRKEEGSEGDITHFQALMTALAATVGTGNIAGVATAIVAGGPGALFWMWIVGLFGMATKYSEAVLAVKFRKKDKAGTLSGGPMYYISEGIGWKWLGVLFAVFASISAFGIGNMVQSNSVADGLNEAFGIPFWITGIVLSALAAAVILGGIKSIGKFTGVLVPIMIVFYMGGAIIAILINYDKIPAAFMLVIKHAFSPTAASGGFIGATIMMTIRNGVAKGVFSNESGLGSSPIAAAAAQTKDPVSQALVSMTQTFIDTLVVCTLTGFAIITSGVWDSGVDGAPLTSNAFAVSIPGGIGGYIVAIALTLFAFSTLLGWSYYGEKSFQFLFGEKSVKPYRIVFCLVIIIGAVAKLQQVWLFAEIMNGLMALPNLVGLLGLSGIIVAETRKYFNNNNML